MTQVQDTPRVYVGTYAKYNNGSLRGAWIDLTEFDSKEEFLEHCAELHNDEEDPELMFQDWENDPGSYISESDVDSDLWDYLSEIESLSEDEKEAYADYKANDSSRDLDDFRDDYQGQFKDEEDYAYHIVDECYDLEKTMGNLASYFDYEKFGRDLFMCDYWISANGHVFRNS